MAPEKNRLKKPKDIEPSMTYTNAPEKVELKKDTGQAESGPRYVFRLFVSGMLPYSLHAINNITRICNEHLANNYSLEIIDINHETEFARQEQIIAIPVLIMKLPLPEIRLIGDLSDTKAVLRLLNFNRS